MAPSYMKLPPTGKLKKLTQAAMLGHAMMLVQRNVHLIGQPRRENDAEHCYQLCLACWCFIEANHLDLRLDVVLMLCLSHDLVEVHAGDTCAHAPARERREKVIRENKAYQKLSRDFKAWRGMLRTIREYREGRSREAQFVAAMDKLLPLINIYLDNGRDWKLLGLTLQRIRRVADKKISKSGPLYEPYQVLLELVTKAKIIAP